MSAGHDAPSRDVLTAAVAQVRDEDGAVLGTGFLVAENLLISCAHVLVDGGYGPGDVVPLVFPRAPGAPSAWGRVLAKGWRDPQEQDIALVRLMEVPAGVAALSLGSAAGCRGHRVRSLGFPEQAPLGGHFGSATVVGVLPAADRAGDLLQLTDANDLTTGFSGGPVLDETTGLVVGMLTAITAPDGHDRGQGIAYATPTAVLRDAWPAFDVLDVSPYRGLEPFTAADTRWFRGREEAVRRVVAALAGGQRVVLLLGPSGAGKSSLVQAGVLPALAAGRLPGSDRWHQVVVRPGPGLSTVLKQAGLPGATPAGITAAVTGLMETDLSHDRLVLVVDQFEELLAPTAEPQPQALATLTAITEAIQSQAALSVVLVMRDDFYPRLSALAPTLLQAALQARGVLNVPTMLGREELDAIVTGPAGDLGVEFEAGLAQRIVSDVLALGSHTAEVSQAPVTVLPLLEVALSQLWERRLDYDGRLTHDAYRRIGAVTGALADWCGAALRELDEPQQRIAQRVLTALVRPADQALNIPAARQRLPLDYLRDLAGDDGSPKARRAVDEVLAVLSRHRVITTDRVRDRDQAGDDGGTSMAELIHDTLIRDWGTLRRWVEQDTRFHDWLHRARSQYAHWQKHHDPQDLPTGTVLAEGVAWSRRRRLPADLRAFLNAGRRRQQAAERRSRRLNAVLAAFLALALAASGVALWQRHTAITAQQTAQSRQFTAESRQLAAQSAALLTSNPDLASLLAVAAYRTSQTSEAVAALTNATVLPLRRRLIGPAVVFAVAFSPDGRTLATANGDGTVRLWDAGTGKTIATLTGHTGAVSSVAFSPDGRTLATAGYDRTARLWDAATGRSIAVLRGHIGPVRSVAFSPDGRTLATASSDGTVGLWDVASSKGTVGLWDVGTGDAIRGLVMDDADGVSSVAFSPDGHTLATAGHDHIVRLWDVATGKATATLTGHTDEVRSVAFSPDGRTLATAGSDGTVRLWDVATGKTVATLTGHADEVSSVAFSPDGRTLATAGDDHTARLWDVATDRTITTLTGHTGAVESVAFSPDGHTLATAGDDHTARLWDVATGDATATLTGHTGSVESVAFSPDGRTLATASVDGNVRLWDVATRRSIAVLTGQSGPLSSVAFSPDGRTVASAGYDQGTLWDVATGKATAVLTGHTDEVRSVVFSPDGRTLATANGDGTARLWDVATGGSIAVLTGQSGPLSSVAFSPDGRTLATAGSDGIVRLWDVAADRTTATLTGHDQHLASMAFSPDGHTLATYDVGHGVVLWDVVTGKTTATLISRTDEVQSVAFSPDGRTLATANGDGTVRLWDVVTGKTAAVLTGHTGTVNSVAFSPDGHTLATAGVDYTARLWTYTTPDTAISIICKAVARDLTPAERAAYLPPEQTTRPACPNAPESN